MIHTDSSPTGKVNSFFRTRAWVQSWLDTWGKDPRIELIDIGGRDDPLEKMYLINHKIKGILPVRSLVLAGCGFADFYPPRAEYNNIDLLIQLAGGVKPLMRDLCKLQWNQLGLSDFCEHDSTQIIDQISQPLYIVRTNCDLAYRIEPTDIESYKAQLSASTRAKYFNRRQKLSNYGSLEFYDFDKPGEFFSILNEFHIQRWGRPCYSRQTENFLRLFIDRFREEGGQILMQAMQINGEIVSVLFDLVWENFRYNLQSGYDEGRFGQLALGSLHLGFAIETALKNNQGYDFLAGNGKQTNYKQKIATKTVPMDSFCLARGWLKHLYKLYGK